MRIKNVVTVMLTVSMSVAFSASGFATEQGSQSKQVQTQGQKSDHGLDRDLIRRTPSPPKPKPSQSQASSGHPGSKQMLPNGGAIHKTQNYGPVLKVKPQGMQPGAKPAEKRDFNKQPQKRTTSFGVLLGGKSGDDTKTQAKPRQGFAVKPKPLHGIEPDEIDVK